ncbi:hypothetical protein [Streptomyces sp. NBC_01014]|uniref:hypothetical protein n=1 Tax=Streptomyces sp. NBC_01014 TaxID=2903719 RepID=UPI0038681841|nr:hypothetical protein OG282_17735 [Streptomyces sp. NBC_01014]
MSTATEGVPLRRRTGVRVLLAVVIGCYVLAVTAGMFLLSDDLGFGLLALLWVVAGVLLTVLICGLGVAVDSALYAALFIVLASVMSAGVAGMARDDLTLQQRGARVTATVVKERIDPIQGRKARQSHYTLQRRDGTPVPGPEMTTQSDRYDVGNVLTVIADPQGKLAPRTPDQASATGELAGSGALALLALAAVGWMTWRGSDAGRRRAAEKGKKPSGSQKAYQVVTGDHSTEAEQEEKLREALRTYPTDRRGYIKVLPEEYPGLSQQRAARIAWEVGLRAEAAGNRGSWRFGENVLEEVPHE